MTRILRAIHVFAIALALLFMLGLAVGGIREFIVNPPGEGQAVDAGIWFGLLAAAIVALVHMLYCATIGYTSCQTSRLFLSHFVWLGIFTWWGWFSPGRPKFRFTEPHSLDPVKIAAEGRQHFIRAIGLYLVIVAVYSILPLMKIFKRWRKPPQASGP